MAKGCSGVMAMASLVRGWRSQSKIRELLAATLRRDLWAVSSVSYVCGGSWCLHRAQGTAWPEGVVASPETSAPLVSPGKGLGEGPCRWQSHSNHQSLRYPSGSSTTPPVSPSPHWSLHHSILLLVPPSSHQSLCHPFILSLVPPSLCGKQGRELPFQSGTCSPVQARPLEGLHCAAPQDLLPQGRFGISLQGLLGAVSTQAQDWPTSLCPNPFSSPLVLAPGPCTGRLCLAPSPLPPSHSRHSRSTSSWISRLFLPPVLTVTL